MGGTKDRLGCVSNVSDAPSDVNSTERHQTAVGRLLMPSRMNKRPRSAPDTELCHESIPLNRSSFTGSLPRDPLILEAAG